MNVNEIAGELWRGRLLDITWAEQDKAHRQTAFLTVQNLEQLNDMGWPFPVSGDATTRWLSDDDL